MMKPKKSEIDTIIAKLRSLANSAKYKKAYQLARKMNKKYPNEPRLIFYEAVLYGDDTEGRTKKEIAVRHKKAASQIKPLLKRMRGMPRERRSTFRNEFYWFSHQPYKQYLLGVEGEKAGEKRAHYSQGVGAVELARNYFKDGRIKMGLRWSKKAEIAWKYFFRDDSNWYNSYLWYAQALGFQRKFAEMENALKKASKISGCSMKSHEILEVRREVEKVLSYR